MPRTIKFHLDEHCAPAIATGLRLHGVDVTTTPEAGLRSALDEEHIAFALATNRVVITQDEGFLRLNAAGVNHRGVAFCAMTEGCTITAAAGAEVRGVMIERGKDGRMAGVGGPRSALMSAKNVYHDLVVRTLIADGWTITHDPLTLSYGGRDLFVSDESQERILQWIEPSATA